MRRRATALGAVVMALAVAPAPADAAVDLQSVQRSIAAAQVGPVKLNLPVRVGSPGNNQRHPYTEARARGTTQGSQTSRRSAGGGPGAARSRRRCPSACSAAATARVLRFNG